ncbi:MAG: ABC transporter ATP-binding protein [Phycisphaerales bacterium]|nr:ABC transporter ATP-binding protein [Phycisphaerales bacterium]
MSDALIDIRDAWKIYRIESLEVPAVSGVTVQIPRGQFVAITGASGSGKSTFMNLVGCLDRLDRGQYLFEGKPIERFSRTQLAALRSRRISFVFQAFNLLKRTSIVDNVALPLMYQGIHRRVRRRRATEMLERVGLGDRLKHQPNQLSGGQQQRVAIARALVTEPGVVLADEPTGNLDSKTSIEIMNLFRTINRERGVSIMLVTHEPDIAAYAERLVVFRDGRIINDELRTPAVHAA